MLRPVPRRQPRGRSSGDRRTDRARPPERMTHELDVSTRRQLSDHAPSRRDAPRSRPSPDDRRRRGFLTVASTTSPNAPRRKARTMTLLQTAPRPVRSTPFAAASARGATKTYGNGDTEVARPRRRRHRLRRRPVHRHHGPLRLGQVDAHALHGRPRPADRRLGHDRRRRHHHAPARSSSRCCAATGSASSSRPSTWCRR